MKKIVFASLPLLLSTLCACVQARPRDPTATLSRLGVSVTAPHVERSDATTLHLSGVEGSSSSRSRRVELKLVDDRLFHGAKSVQVETSSAPIELAHAQLLAALGAGITAEEATVRSFDRSIAVELSDVALASSSERLDSVRFVFDFRSCAPSVVAVITTTYPVIGGYAVRISGTD